VPLLFLSQSYSPLLANRTLFLSTYVLAMDYQKGWNLSPAHRWMVLTNLVNPTSPVMIGLEWGMVPSSGQWDIRGGLWRSLGDFPLPDINRETQETFFGLFNKIMWGPGICSWGKLKVNPIELKETEANCWYFWVVEFANAGNVFWTSDYVR
jgi:hypothetical protein